METCKALEKLEEKLELLEEKLKKADLLIVILLISLIGLAPDSAANILRMLQLSSPSPLSESCQLPTDPNLETTKE